MDAETLLQNITSGVEALSTNSSAGSHLERKMEQ